MSAEISSPRVLIIEDESTIARFIAAALQDEGFTTFIEGTMKGGLTAAFTRQPDLLIVDHGLPDRGRARPHRRLAREDGAPDDRPLRENR